MKFAKFLGITLQRGMKSLYDSRINVLLVSLSFSSLKVSGLPKLYARCLSTESNGISDCYSLPAESMRWCVCDCEVSKNWYLCSSGPSSLSWIMLTEMKYVRGSQKRIHWVLLSFNTSISSWNLECLICSGNPEKYPQSNEWEPVTESTHMWLDHKDERWPPLNIVPSQLAPLAPAIPPSHVWPTDSPFNMHRYCSWSLCFLLHGLGLTRAFLLFQDPCLLGAVGSDQLSSRRRWTSGAYGATIYISLPCVSRYSCGFTAFATCESTGSNKKSSIDSR